MFSGWYVYKPTNMRPSDLSSKLDWELTRDTISEEKERGWAR
jgi:hypothetical protein